MLRKLLKNIALFNEKNYINNEWIAASNGATLPVVNPADDNIIGHIPRCNQIEALQAVEVAKNAWSAWRSLTNSVLN